MEFSLSAAAKATGRGKSTIHNAIKSGKLSARRTEDGSYRIDASELTRVFTLNPAEQGSKTASLDDPEPQAEPQGTELALLRLKVSMLEEQATRNRELYRETLDDLRKRLDAESEERRALQRQLMPPATERPQESPSIGRGAPEPPRQPRSLLARLLGR